MWALTAPILAWRMWSSASFAACTPSTNAGPPAPPRSPLAMAAAAVCAAIAVTCAAASWSRATESTAGSRALETAIWALRTAVLVRLTAFMTIALCALRAALSAAGSLCIGSAPMVLSTLASPIAESPLFCRSTFHCSGLSTVRERGRENAMPRSCSSSLARQ